MGRVPVTLGILIGPYASSVNCGGPATPSPNGSSVTCLTSGVGTGATRNVNFFSVNCYGGVTVNVADQDTRGNRLSVRRPGGAWDPCPTPGPNCIKVRFDQFENITGVQPLKDLTWRIRVIATPTATRTPASTPTPTATPATNRAALRPGVRALTIRAEPGVGGSVQGYVVSDQVVEILEGPRSVGPDVWFRVRNLATGVTGWVNGAYLRLPEPAGGRRSVALQPGDRARLTPTARGLNIRSGPGVDNPVVGHVRLNDVLIVSAGPRLIAGVPWYDISNQTTDVEGWVSGVYLVPAGP
ncbi:MAG: SH3 domain-containing protein [Chloroflexi bacterium]|nr:MAG: SH3 domain-containing protein [Chloroflexota bacterium]